MFQTKYSHLLLDSNYYSEKVGPDLMASNSINKLELQFYIKSHSYFIKVFIAMLLLIEKQTHVRVQFLINKTIISKKRTIRIGCIATLYDVSLIRFLREYVNVNLNRTINPYYVLFNKSSLNIHYIVKKILFYNIFYYDNDVSLFYDLFDSSVYEILFLFTTTNDSIIHNKVLMSLHGFHRISEIKWEKQNGGYVTCIEK